jgi:hypothetical protein
VSARRARDRTPTCVPSRAGSVRCSSRSRRPCRAATGHRVEAPRRRNAADRDSTFRLRGPSGVSSHPPPVPRRARGARQHQQRLVPAIERAERLWVLARGEQQPLISRAVPTGHLCAVTRARQEVVTNRQRGRPCNAALEHRATRTTAFAFNATARQAGPCSRRLLSEIRPSRHRADARTGVPRRLLLRLSGSRRGIANAAGGRPEARVDCVSRTRQETDQRFVPVQAPRAP